MLVSYKWLNELVDLHDLTPNEIAHRLTLAGVEVENITKLSNANHLVVGEVKECELVQDTHLHICKVDLGKKHGVKQIVCGAPNVRKGLKVIVALPGAQLPNGEIKVANIRGIESNGMCCSLLELGVDSKYVDEIDLSGIHELGNEFEIGDENVLEHLGLDDTVLTLKLLANRPDLLSIYNVALEVATLFNREVKPLVIEKIKGEPIEFKVGSRIFNIIDDKFNALKISNTEISELLLKPNSDMFEETTYEFAFGDPIQIISVSQNDDKSKEEQ